MLSPPDDEVPAPPKEKLGLVSPPTVVVVGATGALVVATELPPKNPAAAFVGAGAAVVGVVPKENKPDGGVGVAFDAAGVATAAEPPRLNGADDDGLEFDTLLMRGVDVDVDDIDDDAADPNINPVLEAPPAVL